MKNTGKPPLAKSPIRLRPRRTLRSASLQTHSVPQTPPGSLIKSQKAHIITRSVGFGEEESTTRPEYNSISWELRALARMVKEDLGTGAPEIGREVTADSPVAGMFERGRCYDEYSARRNERLAKKNQVAESLGVRFESPKRRVDAKRSKSLCRSVEATPAPRYALRSMSKESEKKTAAAVNLSVRPSYGSERKAVGSRSYRRI